jgi:very-short-patch-repair endonuclease
MGYGQRFFAREQKLDIVSRYETGESINVLRIEYDCDPESIKAVLVEAGTAIRTHHESTQTDAFREKSRQTLLKRLPSMRGPATNTAIEQRMQDALKRAGIGFTTQSVLLDRYLVDFELHQAPIVIEADGAQHTLRDQRNKDAERDAALTAAGYRVFRFTGSEINRDAAECVQCAIEACGLTPDHNPVYEIRTRFAGPAHPRWSQVEFTCEQCGTLFSKPPSHRASEHAFCTQRCYGDWLRDHPETNAGKHLQRDWTGLPELYEAGMSIRQLSEHFKCSNKAIHTAMRKLGVKVRQIGGRRVPGGFYQTGVKPGS